MKKILSFVFIVLLLNTTIASAATQEIKSTTNKQKVEVEIMYNIKGNDFLENVVFEDGTKLSDYDYTIKTVPTPRSFYPIGDYFNYAAWITRDGVISLSVDPKEPVRTTRTQRNMAWSVLASPTHGFGSSSNWKNGETMRWQFECHYWFAENKQYWNLEPSRTASSYADVVANGCNP